jgi:hypothetical protein
VPGQRSPLKHPAVSVPSKREIFHPVAFYHNAGSALAVLRETTARGAAPERDPRSDPALSSDLIVRLRTPLLHPATQGPCQRAASPPYARAQREPASQRRDSLVWTQLRYACRPRNPCGAVQLRVTLFS